MAKAVSSTTDRYAAAKLILSRIAHPVAIIGAAHDGERSCGTGIAMMWCHVREEFPTGDHILFIGEVVGAVTNDRKIDALLRYRRRYMRMGHWTSEEAPEGYPT